MVPDKVGTLDDFALWSQSKQAKTLIALAFHIFLAELEWIGAFSEAKWVPHDFTTLQVLFFVYFGRNAENFYTFTPFWYNGCQGDRTLNYFETTVGRQAENIGAVMNLLISLCEWDPDQDLKDEYAALFHLCAREIQGVHNDQ